MEAGNEAMQRVLGFAQTTPFQIETATKAFIALKSAGVEPTNRMLKYLLTLHLHLQISLGYLKP